MPAIAGRYVRLASGTSPAEITITPIAGENDQYQVSGEALYRTDRPSGPNLGNLEFVGTLTDGSLHYSSPNGDKTYTIRLSFAGTKMNVTEENTFEIYGHNVRFEGEYEGHEAILKQ